MDAIRQSERREALARLEQLLGRKRLLRSGAALAPYESDALTAFRAAPVAVALPEERAEVVEIVRLCAEHGLPFVARGSGTSLSGG